MSSPIVSVLMSVFNGQAFLPEAIESILGQTFRDFEFVIIDDGSTDKTAEILAEHAVRDPRIRVHRHENKGRANSLNIGIELSRSSYIARMDADDISLPNRLKEQVEFMGRNPSVGLLSGSYDLIDVEGRLMGTVPLLTRDEEIKQAMLVNNAMCHPAAMMRREVAIACGGYRKAFLDADDYDLWLRISERSQLANLEQPILQYRVHSKQVSVVNSSHQRLCVLAARTAAAFRKQGRPDPLSGVEHITPELLRNLGVTTAEIKECLLTSHKSSVKPPVGSDSETVLRGLEPMRRAFRVRLWHPLLNLTRPIRHTLGLRQKSIKNPDKEGKVHKDFADKNNFYQDWGERDFAAPSPHFVKQRVLLRNGLPDATWVETGTYMGDTTSILSTVAKMVYSIEPEPALFSKAEEKFRNTSNVKIIKGLSEDVFPKLLPAITGNICFWLDGHYSADITFKGPQDTPIVEELTAIERNIAKMSKIVVMVDDIRCFDPKNPEFSAYPSVDLLVDWARKHNLTWHIEHDIFIAKNC
jgi:hypothetical protein